MPRRNWTWAAGAALLIGGCGKADPVAAPSAAAPAAPAERIVALAEPAPSTGRPPLRPITLGGASAPETSATKPSAPSAGATAAEAVAIRTALKPLQVVVGEWRGNTFRDNAVHEAGWAWDLKTDPAHPALVMTAGKNPFFKEARLTYRPSDEKYVLTLAEPDGPARRLEGVFTEPPRSVAGDDGRTLQRTYKLELEQVEPADGEQWRAVLNQQENNRFLMELSRRRGAAPFRKFDTVSEQRQGTSFALSDEGYGEKTCVISGGLGTISVAYKGKTYYVCCSGCKAAFEDEPEKWIAEYEKKQAMK